ncbi:1-aminocyclopropane-1-carboxylate synthase-like protein 1 [Aplysia californica]|uniref:1-aminocyclopropane-1-carboxylate synthase-like protein 1 n=1 Tax=Aplysia californica TaxID=6500 RepID=A0ABM0JTJ3_APLCA|nr:1-aminocyclopropane-1-carboxylate synthase-like protein 1 [Aplysia californica]
MAERNSAEQTSPTEKGNEKPAEKESLEDLLTKLGQQINSSDWLQQNTPEKFATENPEVAKAFKRVAPEKEVEDSKPQDNS